MTLIQSDVRYFVNIEQAKRSLKGIGRFLVERRIGPFLMSIGEFPPEVSHGTLAYAWSSVELLLEGSVVEELHGKRSHQAPGCIVSYSPGCERRTVEQRDVIRVCNVRITSDEIRPVSSGELHAPARLSRSTLMWQVFHELLSEGDHASSLALESLGYELSREHGPDVSRRMPRWCAAVRDALHEATVCPSLDSLAQLAGVHACHLARAFRNAHGCTVGDYYRSLRMLRATEELAGTSAPIAIVAARAGFSDHAHFTREFHRLFGMPPSLIRSELSGLKRRIGWRSFYSGAERE